MKYIQVAIRRNGLHAIRGWLCNQVQIVKNQPYDPATNDPEGISWFSWTIKQYSVEEILNAFSTYKYITLESYPLSIVLQVVRAQPCTLILHLRTLMDWLSSSALLSYKTDFNINRQMHIECLQYWREYAEYAKERRVDEVIIWYEDWIKFREYRQYIARKLGFEDKGDPYTVVHDTGKSSYLSKTSTENERIKLLQNAEFLELLR